MPVTATEVDIRFRRPPHDVFGIDPFAVRDSLRFRIWPETEVGLTLAGKKPGAGMEPLLEDLRFVGQTGSNKCPYDRLIGAALDGDRWLFARQDTVEAAWEVVDRCSATSPPCIPTPGAAGARRKPTGCCQSGTPGTTRQGKRRNGA